MPDDEIAFDRRTASGIIHTNSCHLVGIIVSSKDDKKSYADVYDGDNASQEKVMRVRALLGDSKVVFPPKPVLMRRGLYVYLNDDADEFTVFWKTITD
ncbi:unnamed protein product [marine sediment metagenome]|uniref:Uncharacterized protein n=1 Tax=marine sediment metagenome TaxID=412755 RepID=X1D6Y2_9ZZZZ